MWFTNNHKPHKKTELQPVGEWPVVILDVELVGMDHRIPELGDRAITISWIDAHKEFEKEIMLMDRWIITG